ncbi:MAG: ABC transporter permease [Lachnospiraceae bacterium]|nr:ABC transporter permease [Lachnospiraceae bacterium]
MQVFKAFMKILKSRFGIAAMYVVIFLAVGFFISRYDDSDELFQQTKMNLMIVDRDNSAASKALTEFLSGSNTVVEGVEDTDDLMDALYYGRIDYAITIPEGFEARLNAGETENLLESRHIHESYSVANIRMLLSEYVNTVNAYRVLGMSSEESYQRASEVLTAKVDVTIAKEETKSGYMRDGAASYFRYLPYIILSVIMSTLTPAFIVMNKKEIRFRTDCSGIRPKSYTLQIFAASVVFVTLVWAVFMAGGIWSSGGMFAGKEWVAVWNSLVFSVFAAVLAMFISEFITNRDVANIVTVIISLAMCFICGVFVGQAMLGKGVLTAARFLPAYWYIRVCRMLDGELPYISRDVMTAIVIEAAFALVFLLLALVVRKARSQGVKA